MDNQFYDRIVYKKNAFWELGQDISQCYAGKKVLLITTKSLVNSHLTEIMNNLSVAKCNFSHFIAKHDFSTSELNTLAGKITEQNYDLFIVFGGVRATMVTKYFANIFCLPYIVCPSMPSGVGYFSNVCINPYDSGRSFVCDYPLRIYISESVIKTCPKTFVKQGVFFLMSFEEMLAMGRIENILLGKKNDYDNISELLGQLKKELKNIMSMDADSKLKLMDILIDVAYNLTKVDIFSNSVFNLYAIMQKVFEKNGEVIYSGECYLLSSRALLLMYINFFKQKNIKRLQMPNIPKIVKNIKNNEIFAKKLNNLPFFDKILTKKDLITRINNLKEEFLFQCKNHLVEQDKMQDIIKSYDNIITLPVPQIDNVFTAMSVLPYVAQNNFVVSLIASTGYTNVF